MSKRGDETTSRGWSRSFHSTHWTEIFDAKSGDQPRRHEALRELLGRYWKPVYFYLRCKGHDREDAKDLTQGFFHEVVLGRDLIQQADRAKGRFRTFLLTALDRYATDVHRAQKAKQRTPKGGLVPLEGVDGLNVPQSLHYTTPLELYDYAWASALLDQVLAEVAEECHERDKTAYWEVFQARVLRPIMDNAESPSLARLCEKYGIPSNAKASKMSIAVKRRFRALLRRHVRQLVESDAQVDDEIRYLMRIFSRSSGRS